MSRGRGHVDGTDTVIKAVVVFFVLVIIAVSLLVRIALAQGHWTCVFANDPAQCGVIAEATR